MQKLVIWNQRNRMVMWTAISKIKSHEPYDQKDSKLIIKLVLEASISTSQYETQKIEVDIC